ncbi:MAG: response regulator, partial [Dehalococcoidia bacterium]
MASDIRGPRVLVVEDDGLLRRLVVRALQQKTDSVVPCGDATAAKAALADGPFDAAAVDINLPDGSGLEVIERTRSLNPEAGIVAVTGHVGVEVAVRSMKAGADDFLTKPFEIEVLWHIINKSV